MKKKKVIGIVGVIVLFVIVVGVIKESFGRDKQTNEITLEKIKEINGGVMPEYEQKENGTLLWLNGCFSERKIMSVEDAILALDDMKGLLGIRDVQLELQETYTEKDDLGILCQFEQFYKGIYVYGSMISLWSDYEGNAGFLRADCTLMQEGFVCEPTISMEEAQEKAIKQVPFRISSEIDWGVYEMKERREDYLCIFDTGKNIRLAWRVYLIVDGAEYESIIDAENGDLLYICKISCSATEEKLEVISTGLQGKLCTINITKNTNGIYELQDKTRKIVVYNGGGSTSKFTMFTSKTKTTWDVAAVSTMFHLRTIYDYYLNLTGRYSYNGAYLLATARIVKAGIHTGIVDNAYWSGSKSMILIGTGSSTSATFYPISFAVAKDIVAHEFTHAVISDRTSLESVYYGPAGAINEAYADIFGCLIEGDWKIGEDITKKKALRDIAIPFNTNNPSKVGGAFYQDYKTDTSDYGGIHKNSTVISHIAYVLGQNGINKSNLAKLWYRSLCLGYGKDTDFYDVRVNVLAAAKALGFSSSEIAVIQKAFDDANITQATCQEDSSSYKSLYEKLCVTNQSINQSPLSEYVLQWNREDVDLDLYVEGRTKEGEEFSISYENQEYINQEGELVAYLVCDYTKGKAEERIRVLRDDVEIIKCQVKVYGDEIVNKKDDIVSVIIYERGSEKEKFIMPKEVWKEWCVF